MADDTRTLILRFQAEVETARQQLTGLVGTLGDTATQVDQRLSRIEASFDRTSTGISTRAVALGSAVGSTFGTIAGNILADLPSALVEVTRSAVDTASTIKNTAEALGIGTDALQNFRIGATKAGVEVADADKALDKFVGTTGKAASGNKAAVSAFDAIGVSLKDSNGNLKPFNELLGDTFDGIAKLPDPARQAAAAVKLFGENGDRLLPFLRGGSTGLDELATAAETLGLKLSPATIERLDQLGNKAEAIKQVFTAQLAAGIAENGDALIVLANGIVAASTAAGRGLQNLLDFYAGSKKIREERGILATLTASDEEKLAVGRGVRLKEQFRTSIDGFASAPEETPRAGGAVVDPPARATRAAAAPKGPKPFDLRGETDKALAGANSFSKELDDSLTGTAKQFSELQGETRTLRDTLKSAFDPGPLSDLVQQLPDLSGGISAANQAATNFIGDLSYGLANALVTGGNLGDVLVDSFARAGVELIASNLFSFLTGGLGGGGIGKALGTVGKFFGGFFADGGDPPVGQASIVGERGREWFIPKVPGTIVPFDKMGGRGNTTIVNDLRGAIVESELYDRINAVGARAAQAGALGGRQLAAQDLRRRARQRLG